MTRSASVNGAPLSLDAVVKLGGSLLAGGSLPSLLATLGRLAATHRLVVVPGGGPFADGVRRACSLHDPGASAAHWMAILAMDQHAHLLAGLLPTARLTTGPEEIAKVLAEGLLPVLAPFRWLRAVDPLPHGWHVTSDSIAAWVAARLSARRLVLLKSLDDVPAEGGGVLAEAPLGSPALAGIVDEYFAHAVEPGLECWIVSGREPERLSELLGEGRTRGTRLR
jgi:5-(aminomethyl)-3-furanmethanol phosphate kinase